MAQLLEWSDWDQRPVTENSTVDQKSVKESFCGTVDASNYNIFSFYILVPFFGFINNGLPAAFLYLNTVGY